MNKRPYTWSGFTDSALVVSFGDAFPFKADDRKFVFWNLANNIPVWHLNNGALMSHGFLETWDDIVKVNGEGRVKGCIEPMSDRLLAFVDLEVVEDNEVRKVIKWTYEIVNPDYKYPAFGLTTQRAEAIEYYYIYADGSIVRKAEYEHTIHPEFKNWYEVTELIVVAGENQQPRSLFETPSLTMHDLGKTPVKHNNLGGSQVDNGSARLGAVALTAHVKNAPELFYAFSDDPSVPATNSGLPFTYDLSWHNRNLDFGHWPVNKEPYNTEANSNLCVNWSQWPQHISHSSFIGVGVHSDQAWDFTFLKREDGTTKYRQFLMLMGMNERGSLTSVEDKTNSWLFPGTVTMTNDSSLYKGYSHQDKYFKFETTKGIPACYFQVVPKTKLVNPILSIKGWGNNPVFVSLNGMPLNSSQYIKYVDTNDDLLLLVTGSYIGNVSIDVSTRQFIATSLDDSNITKSSIRVYPNPSNQNIVNIDFDAVETVELVVLSITGNEILRTTFKSDRYQLYTDNIPAGSYLLRIKSGVGIETKKIVIR